MPGRLHFSPHAFLLEHIQGNKQCIEMRKRILTNSYWDIDICLKMKKMHGNGRALSLHCAIVEDTDPSLQ